MRETEVKLGLLKQFNFFKYVETYPGFTVKKSFSGLNDILYQWLFSPRLMFALLHLQLVLPRFEFAHIAVVFKKK